MGFHIIIIPHYSRLSRDIGKQCQASVVLPGKRRKWYLYLPLIFSFSSAVCVENNSIRTSKFIHVGAFVNGKGFMLVSKEVSFSIQFPWILFTSVALSYDKSRGTVLGYLIKINNI